MSKRSHSDPDRQSVFDWAAHLQFSKLEREQKLPRGVLTALIRQESFGRNDAESPVGAIGLFQIMPRIAHHYGINAHDPHQASRVAAKELGHHYRHYISQFEHPTAADREDCMDKALIAYNFGQGRVTEYRRKHGRHHWKDHVPRESRIYIDNIAGDMAADAAIRSVHFVHHDDAPAVIDDALFNNRDIAKLVRRRLNEHGYDAGPAGHTTDARMHKALKEFEQNMAERGVRSASDIFRNDGELDFASLNMLICRTPGIREKLDKPKHKSGHGHAK